MKAINLRIILQAPTPGVMFGLQKGKGSHYETIQKKISDGSDLVFEWEAEAKYDEGGNVNFTGPYTQGPPGQRFVYIDIGTYAGQAGSPFGRRLKIPLTGI